MKSCPAFMADSILSSGAIGVPKRNRSCSGSWTPYLSSQLVDQPADRLGELNRRVILLRGSIERDRLAVVDDLAL